MSAPVEPPFYKRVQAELDARERGAMLSAALWMLAGGVLLMALAWTLWVAMP